ncbi:MAG TPA: hypothetical protein VGL86_19295 [Polyangia bacterium]
MDTDEENVATPAPKSASRYPLAYDSNGNPIEIPDEAVAWRVRRGGGRRGRPRNVFDGETGRQLEIPLGSTLDDLISTGCPPDRYLLYPIDTEGRIIAGLVAVTEVPESDDEDDDGSSPVDEKSSLLALLVRQQATIERQNEQLARALESTVSGYGPVRPPAPVAPTPIMMEQPMPPPPAGGGGWMDSLLNAKPEQLMQFGMLAKQVYDMIRGGGFGGGGPVGG